MSTVVEEVRSYVGHGSGEDNDIDLSWSVALSGLGTGGSYSSSDNRDNHCDKGFCCASFPMTFTSTVNVLVVNAGSTANV